MQTTKITVQVVVNKDRLTVWDRYTNPDHIVNWNFASDDWHCPSAGNNMKIGGTYKARMEAKDGSFGFDFEAVYSEINPEKSFTYKLSDGRQVNVQFKDTKNESTEMTIVFDAENQNPIDMQRNGWQAILNSFKQYVEQINI